MPIEHDDVSFNKAAIIERSIRRAHEEYNADRELKSFTHIVAKKRLGMPQTSSESFILLEKAGLLKKNTAERMVAMVGFRNVSVHEYQALDMSILRAIGESE